MNDTLNKVWKVTPCPCGSSFCKSALIEPNIVKLAGSIDKSTAEHIVGLHNFWLSDTKPKMGLMEYEVGLRCTNCNYHWSQVYEYGKAVPKQVRCPNCGCLTLSGKVSVKRKVRLQRKAND